MKVDVLNDGFVRLVDHMGSDLSIVRAARVSYDADWREGDEKKDEKLIRYLMKNRHTSPFEAVEFCFEVKAPIFIFRQWHRHRTWSYNEVSARYTELNMGFYVPDPTTIGTQSKHNKQVRDQIDPTELTELEYQAQVAFDQHSVALMRRQNDQAWITYEELVERGVPREIARSVLPLAAYSRMFANVDLHNLLHFLELRMHSHAQWEIQEYARAMHKIAHTVVPVTMKFWDEFTLK